MTKTAVKENVTAGKAQVSWRIRADVLNKLREDCHVLGFSTVPALVNYILVNYYTQKGR